MEGRLFAVGDIHGCFDKFCDLLEKRISIRKSDRLVLLGDYIDRGKKSREVVEYIIGLQQDDFDIIALIGNHESMLLDALAHEKGMINWIMNGGVETMTSFNITNLKQLDKIYVDFFKSLPYYYSYRQFLFVHAGFNDDSINPLDDKYHMIWTRREKYENPFFNGKIIIHGHTPVFESECLKRIYNGDQVINIDTGCVYDSQNGYGRLSALELNSGELFSI